MDAARWVVPEKVADVAAISPGVMAKLLYRHPPLRAMAWFRFASWTKDVNIPGVAGWVQRRLLRQYGLELPPGAVVGGGLYIAHPVGCTLVAQRIGTNVTVIANVTFGYRKGPAWPVIGDNVEIGSGARILGAVRLGDGCLVGANAVVVDDVPPGATAVGVPARIITRQTSSQ
jgi:serine O-acetyltransferase